VTKTRRVLVALSLYVVIAMLDTWPSIAVAETTELDASSASWRKDKQLVVVGELGSAVVPLPSAGLTAGWHLWPDIVLEANYSKGQVSLYVVKAYSEVEALRSKIFWGNSFYTNLGAARRTIGIALSPQAFIGTDILDARLETTELVADFGIGNMWEWHRFTLGIDWLGIMLPIARLSSEDNLTGGRLSADAERAKSILFDRLAGGRSYQLMGMYMGVSF